MTQQIDPDSELFNVSPKITAENIPAIVNYLNSKPYRIVCRCKYNNHTEKASKRKKLTVTGRTETDND